jgi:hypothetical protein
MEMEDDKSVEQNVALHGIGAEGTHGNALELQTEADLSEQEDDNISIEEELIDYSLFTKAQLSELLKDISKETDTRKVDRVLKEVKPVWDDMKERDRMSALNRFILDGGSPDDFEFKPDEKSAEFDTLFKQIREKRIQQLRSLEDQKNDNLRKKLELIEKLRQLVDGQDASNQFSVFKDLQKEWKGIGSVPGTQAKTLWANYHALVDRFYDNQSIYYELKELDRKKNLEAKQELCVRAEKLSEVEKIKDAVKELNELHHEFKHIGPVPAEEKETIWQRFKAASDVVYGRRDEFIKNLQQEFQNNLEQKVILSNEVTAFAEFQSDRIKEWNQKTKEILELQKKWEAIGGLPRAKSKEVNKKFWTAFKAFFGNKNTFFKKLDEERNANLQLKASLVQRAIELKESQDWEKAANELKGLQQKWREIGPVPEKMRDKIFKEFKEACDFFFDQKRGQQAKHETEQMENLKAKEEVCSILEKHVEEKSTTYDILKDLENRFNQIGFVPKKDMSTIRNRYHAAIEKFTQAMGVSEEERTRIVLESQLSDLKNDPMGSQKIYQREQAIRKKIQKVENDIAVWKNNLEFFGRSKNADKYKEEFHAKIDEAAGVLRQLKDQLKLLRTVS